MIILSIILMLAGLLMIFRTPLLWKITESWTSKDGTEPSELYLWNTRFGGVICTLIGFAGLLVYFIM
jgi:uncharacterized membrane protein